MSGRSRGVVVNPNERQRESWGGSASWFTLLSGDVTPTNAMTAGIMEIAPGGELVPHRHDPAEIYHILEGEGLLTIDGVTTTVSAGSTAFIPGDAEHMLQNKGSALLKVFYVFPTDRFSDVVYRFSDP
jgi:quercetin dioxygenase-like cupin family protein